MNESKRFLALFCGAVGLASCGPRLDIASDGIVVQDGDQIRRARDGDSVDCEGRICEPNFIYTANFGGKRRNPTPPPAPKLPDLPFEQLDYSRGVLRLDEAWRRTEGSREVVVAVVDTGVDFNHPDLKNNIWFNAAEKFGRSGIDDDGNGFVDDVYGWDFANNRPNAMDDNNHGTHCAGIIGAEHNGVGTIGVSPKVRIMPIKFLNSQGSGDLYAAIHSIRYATRMGARIISNSWGGGGYSILLSEAIAEAVAQGVVVVAAAGNSASDNDAMPTYPANYPGVVSVASSDATDSLSSFSNYGADTVMVAAPGSQILSTIPGSKMAAYSGTSMAAPQVTGALALALSIKPQASAAELKEKLCSTSVRILTDFTQCGRLDVAALVSSF